MSTRCDTYVARMYHISYILRLRDLEGEQASQAQELERVTSLKDSAVEKATKLELELEAASLQV